MLKATRVSKGFAGKSVLTDLTLVCATGQTTVLLGQSGCGKSTLLRLFMGLLWPDSGAIEIAGTLVTETNARSLRRDIGYVTQDGGLFPHLTVRDNILLAARYFKVEPAAQCQIQPLFAMTKLSPELLGRFPCELSGGQRQRVSLIRALILDPSIVLLDEPMGALDPMIHRELQEDLKIIFSTLRKTVVLVTHDVSEAAFLGEKIIMLNQGAIVQEGSFADLSQKSKEPFVVAFLAAQRSVAWPNEQATVPAKKAVEHGARHDH